MMLPLLWLVLTPDVPVTTQTASNAQLSMQAQVEPAVVVPNAELTITFQITPARGIHIYAPGAEYQVVAVKLASSPGVKARTLTYPPSETYYFEPLEEHVPVYAKPFTLKQVIVATPAAVKGKQTLRLSGTLAYQACSDRVCFKPMEIAFTFAVPVKK